MALRPLNSTAGFSAGDPAITVIQANGDITTINITANGISNLGNVGNVKITGGNVDQYLKTDGAGNLVWSDVANVASNRAAVMPYFIPTGESYIVNQNFQGLYSNAITIDGELTVDGMLIEIVDTVASEDTQVLFDDNGIPTGNAGFTFTSYNGNLNVPGNINPTGNIIPAADDTYDLGRANARWRNGYFGGNTIYLDSATFSVNSQGAVIITNQLGGEFVVSGNGTSSVSELTNGTSNLIVYNNANVAFSVAGTPNVMQITSIGANLTGNLTTGGVKTDNLYYANGVPYDLGGNPGGANTQLQFNNAGEFGGSANLTFSTSTNNLTISGNIVSTTGAIYGNAAGLTNIPGANITGNISGNISNAAHAGTANTVVDAAQPNITSVGTLSSLSVTGNVSAGNVSGTLLAGTLTTAAQPNITSVGTLTELSVSGNTVVGGNLTVNGNLIYINVTELSIKDPIINLQTGANGAPPSSNSGKDVGSALNYYDTQARIAFMGWDTSNAEFAFGSQTTISAEVVTFDTLGNVRAQTFKGNVEATTIAGNLTTATQSNITTVGTLGNLSVTANVNAGNVVGANVVSANYLVSNSGCVSVNGAFLAYNNSTGAAGIFSSLATDINLGLAANITLGSTTGNVTVRGNLVANNNISVNGNITANFITGTLTTSNQPNITTVGTLTSLNVTGNITANNYSANTIKTNSLISKRANISVTTLTVVDSFAVADFRTAKYVIRSSSDIGFESLEVLLIHNNINSYITVYGAINDGGGNTVTLSTGISSGNVELRATGIGANTVINLIGTYVPD